MKIDAKLIRDLVTRVRDENARYSYDLEAHSLADFDLGDQHDASCIIHSDKLDGIEVFNRFISTSSSLKMSGVFLQHKACFITLRGRRCAPFGGKVTEQGLLPKDDIPRWLQAVMDSVFENALKAKGFERPNHALVNVYEPGEGIMAHEDGPAYSPYAAILSLGSACVFDFVSKSLPRQCIAQVYLPVGSLMVFHSSAYTNALHEVRFAKFDPIDDSVFNYSALKEFSDRLGDSIMCGDVLARGKRISITMRHVPNYIS